MSDFEAAAVWRRSASPPQTESEMTPAMASAALRSLEIAFETLERSISGKRSLGSMASRPGSGFSVVGAGPADEGPEIW
jgi:hypothetical protein